MPVFSAKLLQKFAANYVVTGMQLFLQASDCERIGQRYSSLDINDLDTEYQVWKARWRRQKDNSKVTAGKYPIFQ